jgi:hypothetical protein
VLTDKQLENAAAFGEWLRLAIHERELPSNSRVRAAASCLAIAQDHHHAIVVLLGSRLYASSFALARLTFEAFVRGEWLALCATDSQVEKFLKGKEPPRMDQLLVQLEQTDAFRERILSQIKNHTWASLCAYTHTGGLHVQRWNTDDGVEPNYSAKEVKEVLRFAEIFTSLPVAGVAGLMNDDVLAQKVLDKFKERVTE